MKVYKLRTNEGKKLTKEKVEQLFNRLEKELEKKGYHCYMDVRSHTDIRITNSGKQFTIDTDKLGYNIRWNSFPDTTISGWKRTNLPTWKQRVDFNNTVNNFLDKHKLQANVVSGPYTIRTFEWGPCNEDDWFSEVPIWQACDPRTGLHYSEIVEPLTNELVAQAKELKREHQREKRIQARKQSIALVGEG